MKPEDFLQVLQKVQLDSNHKQAITEVLVPPPPYPACASGLPRSRGCHFRSARLAWSWWAWGRRPSCPWAGCPAPPCIPALQKLHSRGDGLLSTDEFQKLFYEFDKRVIKEVTVAGPGVPEVSREVLGVSWR